MSCTENFLFQIFAHLEALSRPARSAWLIPTARNLIIKYVIFVYVTLTCTRHTFQTTTEHTHTHTHTHAHTHTHPHTPTHMNIYNRLVIIISPWDLPQVKWIITTLTHALFREDHNDKSRFWWSSWRPLDLNCSLIHFAPYSAKEVIPDIQIAD